MILEPASDVIEEELLGPEHARQRLAHDAGLVGVVRSRNDVCVELVGFLEPRLEGGFKGLAAKGVDGF